MIRAKNIKIVFSGDFLPVKQTLKNSLNQFSGLAEIFSDCDLHVSNLEAPLTDSEAGIKKVGPLLKADPSSVRLLIDAKVNIACLANNHIFDFSEPGIEDTVTVCHNNGIDIVGIVSRRDGRDHMLIKIVDNIRFGFLNYCENEFSVRENNLMGAAGYDPVKAFYDISYLKTQVDRLVIIYHGGNEYYPLPRPEIRKTFHYLADLGADAVVGHHTHVFSGYEIYNGKPLVYSLGNFFFPPEGEPEESRYGMMCILEFGHSTVVKFVPIFLNPETSNVEILHGDGASGMLKKLDSLSEIIKDNQILGKEWEKYISSRSDGYIKVIPGIGLLGRLLNKSGVGLFRLIPEDKVLMILNLLRCQSHQNIVVDSLKKLLNDE